MEVLKPGRYPFKTGELTYGVLKGTEYAHELSVVVGVNGSTNEYASRGIDLGDALSNLEADGNKYARRKIDQMNAFGFMSVRIGIIEAKVKDGLITADQGGVFMRLIADRFISLHKEHLPAQIPIAPAWRLNTDTVSLERPWKQSPKIPEPSYNVWWTYHSVIASALHHQTRNVVL